MRRSALKTFAATALLTALGALAASDVAARLSIIPGRPGGPRPTSSQVAPTQSPRPTATAAGSVGGCQSAIAAESDLMLAEVRSALGTCLTRGARCLIEQGGSSACCAESALECQGELNRIAAATRRFRETVRAGACGALPLERLLASDGLGFEANVCGSLTPPITVSDHATFADCLQLLMTRDAIHQVALTDVPRAAEALVCMGLDEVLSAALGAEPATCNPTPSPTPSATPIPTHSPTPGPTPTPAGPAPVPTPSPGAGGCQPRLFGPCLEAPFTGGCCNTKQHCAFITGEGGQGFCIADPPSTTPTPATSATPAPTGSVGPTPTASPGTPTPTALPTATPVPTAAPTATPVASPGEPTPVPSATASPGPTAVASCRTATITITTSYVPQSAPDFVAGVTTSVGYPGGRITIPGTSNQSTVLARVSNLTGVSGVFGVGDQDSDQDFVDDRINIGLISTAAGIAPGAFARVVFDCVPGEQAPVAADFVCGTDISSLFGNTVDSTCSVGVETAS